jgi:hypothetical protein
MEDESMKYYAIYDLSGNFQKKVRRTDDSVPSDVERVSLEITKAQYNGDDAISQNSINAAIAATSEAVSTSAQDPDIWPLSTRALMEEMLAQLNTLRVAAELEPLDLPTLTTLVQARIAGYYTE